MIKKRRKLLNVEAINRFKFVNFVLLVIGAGLLISVFISMKMIEEGRILFGGEILYILFQLNFIGVVLVLMVTVTCILHFGFSPVSRMEKILDRVIKGNYSLRMQLRKTDRMKPLAERINIVLELLENSEGNKEK